MNGGIVLPNRRKSSSATCSHCSKRPIPGGRHCLQAGNLSPRYLEARTSDHGTHGKPRREDLLPGADAPRLLAADAAQVLPEGPVAEAVARVGEVVLKLGICEVCKKAGSRAELATRGARGIVEHGKQMLKVEGKGNTGASWSGRGDRRRLAKTTGTEQGGKIDASQQGKMHRAPDPTVQLDEMEGIGSGIPAVLKHGQTVPIKRLESGLGISKDARMVPDLAAG